MDNNARLRCSIPILITTIFTGCAKTTSTLDAINSNTPTIPVEPKNVVYSSWSYDSSRTPKISLLTPPWPAGASAVWGSVGRDHRGHIYVGASCESASGASAHLLEYDSVKNGWADLGGAVEQLKRLKLAKPSESQNKIHTKIWQATDGYLYFASMDESGELDDGTVLPVYGSHLWRTKPGSKEWEHLKAVPEGIIAATLGGSSIYFLGYFGHVVYRFDTKTGAITHTRIGATGGHVSRNLFADGRGHAFVPRVRSGRASLVELNGELDEVKATELSDYDVSPNAESHGIVSWTAMKDGSICFLTDGGRLYRVAVGIVRDLGRIHPDGAAYVSCLMSPEGERWLCGIGHKSLKGEPSYEWIVHDLLNKKTSLKPLTIPVSPSDAKGVLIYGSMTRDDAGRWCVGGAYRSGPRSGDFTPAVWRVEW